MSNEVYANDREISCKAAEGKAIAAFPDFCFTPPPTLATPTGVPIPYPNTGFARDATNGSKTVKITGKEVMLKNRSYFKKSTGDEPATRSLPMGVITHTITGKVYFNSWSMDVKFEGLNIVRHLDLTTHNHMSFPGNSPTWPYLDAAAFSGTGPCKDVAKAVNDNCAEKAKRKSGGKVKRKASMEAMCADPKCEKALKCVLSPKNPSNCCPQPQPNPPKQTPHHIVPASQFKEMGEGGAALDLINPEAKYDYAKAPCICAEGISHSTGRHGEIHSKTNKKTRRAVGIESGKQIPGDKRWNVSKAEEIGAEATAETTGCPKACIEEQVRNGHKKMKIRKDDQIRPTTAGGEEGPAETGGSIF
jgi:hypothetical protein